MRSKKAFYNIISNIVLQVIVIIYGFIVPKIIIKSFGSNVNGLISSITQFLTYISLLESGFGPVVKASLYGPISKKDNKTIANILKTSELFFKKIALIFVIYILLLCIIYPLIISSNFDFIYTISLIIIIAISTFAEYYFGMTYRLFLQASQKNYVISVIQIITYILSIIVIAILANCRANIHLIKLISGIIFVLRPLLQNYYVKKKYSINLEEADSKYKIKQKWDGLAQHIASVIHGNTDITVLTIFTTLSEVSVYSVYYMIVKGVKSLIQSFTGGIDALFGDMIAKKEMHNLNKKFGMYEFLYNTISTIVFSSAILLIVPFVSIFTKGINDTNYIRYSFGYLIVISEYIWAIRLPYSSITLAAGHFKETRLGAWVECFLNLIISLVLVWKFGIIGVTIGTIVAMTIRTIEFIYHTNKYILNRSNWYSIKKIILVLLETILIILICNYLPYVEYNNYFNWIVNAILIMTVSGIITLTMNCFLLKKEFLEVIELLKRIITKKRNVI